MQHHSLSLLTGKKWLKENEYRLNTARILHWFSAVKGILSTRHSFYIIQAENDLAVL